MLSASPGMVVVMDWQGLTEEEEEEEQEQEPSHEGCRSSALPITIRQPDPTTVLPTWASTLSRWPLHSEQAQPGAPWIRAVG